MILFRLALGRCKALYWESAYCAVDRLPRPLTCHHPEDAFRLEVLLLFLLLPSSQGPAEARCRWQLRSRTPRFDVPGSASIAALIWSQSAPHARLTSRGPCCGAGCVVEGAGATHRAAKERHNGLGRSQGCDVAADQLDVSRATSSTLTVLLCCGAGQAFVSRV